MKQSIVEAAKIEFQHSYDQPMPAARVIMQNGKAQADIPELAPPPTEYPRSSIKGSYMDVR